MTDYYVYVLFDWRGIPRYVGKGKGRRWNMHEERSNNNWLKNEFIEQTWLMLGELPKIKVRERLTNKEAIDAEIALIKALGRVPAGPLVNLTDGGEGMPGYRHTKKARQKISSALVGRKQSDAHREKNRLKSLGVKPSDDTRRKMSDSHSGDKHHFWGKKHSQASRAKISASKKGHDTSAETRVRIGDAMRGHPSLVRATKDRRLWLLSIKATRGTKWITDGKRCRRIKPNVSLPKGWRYGKLQHLPAVIE